MTDTSAVDSLRRTLVRLVYVLGCLALLHFVDHAVRGALVLDRGLDPDWNHSGWPFNIRSDKPYIFPISFVVVFGLVVGGLFYTARGRLNSAYWLGVSAFLIAFLVMVHFVGLEPGTAETPHIIRTSYPHPLPRILAMVDLFGMFGVLAAIALQSLRIRLRAGRW